MIRMRALVRLRVSVAGALVAALGYLSVSGLECEVLWSIN